ncbi:LysE/ArgO family amino acid transporter [Nitrospirillum sp. BR 11828]|uniref:LysE/ArgO family amino acid transporter n=1 Tax=Nitrospirillum sp. BR 11828 TaxID=3104325 RepID=UPI002ACA1837|nr:LysE/ArgO family amino acid transporter [Nitrospirillum sp. BR 11828]MDZ5650192.1 LysE/ArgO family amino acid transporter [Nitrospirillum sp. BR 11828]
MNFSVFIAGLSMGLSLIVAIGAQNAFLLRQGLRNRHVFAVCLACALSDAVLIGAGVAGFGTMIAWIPWLDTAMRYAGAAFLAWYGVKSLWSAWHATGALTAAGRAEEEGLAKTLLACLAITWLNPHVYLDTVVLLGAVSTQFDGFQASFAAGAITGSFLFFFSLGYGATRLRPVFARPAAWRVLEGAIALIMWSIAVTLVAGR